MFKNFFKPAGVGIIVSLTIFPLSPALCQDKKPANTFTAIDTRPFADGAHHWYDIAEKGMVVHPVPNQPRYKTTDLREVGDNIVLYQKDNGGWPKNYDIMAVLTPAQKDSLLAVKHILNTTFDNGASYTHVEALATIYAGTGDDKYKQSALKGLEYILAAQYDNGGWPQYYPLQNNYSRYITYNDDGMVGIMQVLKDIVDGKPQYAFVNDERRNEISKAFYKGIQCIVKTQIVDNDTLTAWCQQHNEVTLEPAWARKFEPPSICNRESSELVLFLMSIDKPAPEVVNAIQAAVKWFEVSKIYNTRVQTITSPDMQTPYRLSKTDKVVVIDSQAPPIWTRYYELKTHRPLFCNRDSKVVYSLAEVERERRDGYGWYTYEPQKVLDRYAKWQQKWAPGKNVLKG